MPKVSWVVSYGFYSKFRTLSTHTHTHTHNCFTALFPGSAGSRVNRCQKTRRELLDFMVQGKINRGRQISYAFQQCKNLENRLRFDKVTDS